MKPLPVQYLCTGGAMVPIPRMKTLFDRQYQEGEEYALGDVAHRSTASHNHYFARLQEIFDNLPENETRWPTWEHMRADALITTGWCTVQTTVLDTPKDAKQFAVGIRKRAPYSVIVVRENVVRVADAMSQSRAAMKDKEFQESKKAVLDVCEALLPGLDRRELTKHVDRIAGPDKQIEHRPEPRDQRPAEPEQARLMAPEGPVMAGEPKERASGPPRSRRPETAADYFAYARDWAMAEPDKNKRWAKWDSETHLRDELVIPVKRRIELTDLLKRLDKETP